MDGLIQRTAQSIDDISRSLWEGSSSAEKALILAFLIVTGLAIPVIPLVAIARIVAN
jgi:hypothetical protein